MSWSVYKCNSTNPPYAHGVYGDWDTEFFDEGRFSTWGSTERIPRGGLEKLEQGDMIIAYQTDRNEVVGLAKVQKMKSRGKYLDVYLERLERIAKTKRRKVRDLKNADARIAVIPALQGGRITTIYDISPSDARYLLKGAGLDVSPKEDRSKRGGGFGRDEVHKKKVEEAAMGCVMRYYKSRGWKVEDVSAEDRRYDLSCSRGGRCLHVEVKGSAGPEQSFPISSGEKKCWSTDKAYVLALVTKALADPQPHFYEGPEALKEFEFTPTSYIARRVK